MPPPYTPTLKKFLSIILFAIICSNHLGIVEQLLQITAYAGKDGVCKTDNYPTDEEAEAEKEAKGKEKTEEEEKFCNHYNNCFQFLHGYLKLKAFIAYSTSLNQHPFCEAEVQPPNGLPG